MYSVLVTATDGGGLTGTTTVQVFLDPSNDKPPVINPNVQTVHVKEDASTGMVVHYIQAHDRDGDTLTFSFKSKCCF
jgi:hypothetical protein